MPSMTDPFNVLPVQRDGSAWGGLRFDADKLYDPLGSALPGAAQMQQGKGDKAVYGSNKDVTAQADAARQAGSDAANQANLTGAQYGNTFAGLGREMTGAGAQFRNNATAGYNQAQAARSQQVDDLAQLRALAGQGPGPSIAEQQYKQAADTSMAQSLALARSGRGVGGGAAAMRAAQFQNANTAGQLAQQAGIARMQEQENWRNRQQQYLGMVQQGQGAMRSQDIGAAGQNAQTGLGYAQAGNQLYGLGAQTQLGYNQLGENARQNGQELGYKINAGQLQADSAKYGYDVGASTQANQYNADAQTKSSMGILSGAGAVIGSILSDERDKEGIDSVDITQPGPMQYKPIEKQKGLLGGLLGNILSDERKKEDAKHEGRLDVLKRLAEHPALQPVGDIKTWEDLDAANAKLSGPDLGAVESQRLADQARRFAKVNYGVERTASKNGPPRPSDAGPPVEPERGQVIDFGAGERFIPTDLRGAQGYSYRYKDPNAPGAAPGVHYGPMAQDLEQTPAGRSTVVTQPDGTKMVDTPRLTMVNTAALSEQQRELDDINAKIAQLRAMGGRGR